jgi:hypothetical protein
MGAEGQAKDAVGGDKSIGTRGMSEVSRFAGL